MHTNRSALVLATTLFLLAACGTTTPREQPVLLVNPIYPEGVYDVAQPKMERAVSCAQFSADDAAALLGRPTRTEGAGSCRYYSVAAENSELILEISAYPRPVDEASYRSLRYGQRANIGGNSAWIQDFGPGYGCSIEVALSPGRSGETLQVNAEGPLTCAEVRTVARKVFDRIPVDPEIEPRIIPELDRERAVVDPNELGNRTTSGEFPPRDWIIAPLDDPRFLHTNDAEPAYP